jgi:hypothetical protein
MQGASTATAEIMVFPLHGRDYNSNERIQTELMTTGNTELATHSAVATNPFKAEDTIPRISESMKLVGVSEVKPAVVECRIWVWIWIWIWIWVCSWRLSPFTGSPGESVYTYTAGLSATRRLMPIPMTTHEKTIEDAAE